ncbi:MAG: carbonic anhydrase [Nanoarchaeota archaeon]
MSSYESPAHFLGAVFSGNKGYVDKHRPVLETLKAGQNPDAVFLFCADSRVPQELFGEHRPGTIFSPCNAGNQLGVLLGTAQYGILHTGPKVLAVVGHSDCGAIKAVRGDYSNEPAGIQAELDALKPAVDPEKNQFLSGIDMEGTDDMTIAKIAQANVDYQVAQAVALSEFNGLVERGKLMIIGMMIDTKGVFGGYPSQLYVVNINGMNTEEQIKAKMEDGLADIVTEVKRI